MIGASMRARKNTPVIVAWEARAKNLLKGELKRRGLSYADLVRQLADLGIRVTERNLTNKISRGGFSAAFLLQCLVAAGAREVLLDYRRPVPRGDTAEDHAMQAAVRPMALDIEDSSPGE
jgi:hypothetical protein